MKKYVLFAASALALAGCQSDDYLGNNPDGNNDAKGGAIAFQSGTGATTRAASEFSGAEAAGKLGNKFFVLGTKGELPAKNPTETIVFDNYQVNYTKDTAGKTDDNSSDWNYVGITPTGNSSASAQTIKYWDYSVPQYDFIAYSIGDNNLITTGEPSDNNILGSAIKTPKADGYAAYTLKAASIKKLQECYYTDVTPVVKADYKKPVTLTFRNLTAKVRVAFYETIPGYSVKNLQFYVSTDDTKKAEKDNVEATLYTTNDQKIQSNGEVTVLYPEVGKDNNNKKDYNRAFVSVKASTEDQVADLKLGKINYTNGFINKSAKEASMAGNSKYQYYTAVLPADEGKALTLRMNYTLVSDDGSKEEIHVYGAKAVVPAAYTAWQPNYAYTYIFKISDNTNGSTSTADDAPEGLYPITFDAVVADNDDAEFGQETITTIATPSVTSYAFDNGEKKVLKAYETGNEYPAATTTDIYFSVSEEGNTMTDLNTKGTLYTVNKNVTEAQVIDALQVPVSSTDSKVVGRNEVELTKVDGVTTDQTEIPTDDGKTIKVTANSTAKVTATATATTYAYVYLKANGTASEIVTAFEATGTETATADTYYLDRECKKPVNNNTTLTAGTVYYKKYKNNNNVYGVKVVKTY